MLIDIARLPDWNRAMTAVVEQPGRLETGAEWLVELKRAVRDSGHAQPADR